MHRFFSLAAVLAITACADGKPSETPDVPTATPEAEPPPDKPVGEATTEQQMGKLVSRTEAGKDTAMDSYEMTPSDCDALGKKFGELARADMTAALSAKLNEKQKAATLAQIEKSVSPREEKWISGCMSSLVNKAADHDSIKCALNAKAVKDFDTCINGQGGSVPKAIVKQKTK